MAESLPPTNHTESDLTKNPVPRPPAVVPGAVGPQQASPKRGRPFALDERKKRDICALLSAGSGIARAAQYVGCAPSTIRRAARRDPEFDKRIRDSELHAELEPLRALRKAATTHWRAAAWYLERVESQRYARRSVQSIDPQEILQMLEELGEAIGQEIDDDETFDRVFRVVSKLTRQWERERIATEPTTKRK